MSRCILGSRYSGSCAIGAVIGFVCSRHCQFCNCFAVATRYRLRSSQEGNSTASNADKIPETKVQLQMNLLDCSLKSR